MPLGHNSGNDAGAVGLVERAKAAAIAEINEREQEMLTERKAQYGSRFTTDQQINIEALHRHYRIGVDKMAEAIARAEPSEAWQPIETAELWQVAVVTDGENVALAQLADNDLGVSYWAVDPEDGLDWEPTHWVAPFAMIKGGL